MPYDPLQIDPTNALLSPSTDHLFGTDQFGRDIFSRVVAGTYISLSIGLISVGIAVIFGVRSGWSSGYYGGKVDGFLMRVIDVMLAFPGILLALAIVSMLGPSLTNLMIAVGISSIPTYARLTRGSVLSAREELYVDAARATGVRNGKILRRHLLPNVVAPIIVTATLGVGAAILWAAALSFLGLGSQPPEPEWGRMLSEGTPILARPLVDLDLPRACHHDYSPGLQFAGRWATRHVGSKIKNITERESSCLPFVLPNSLTARGRQPFPMPSF